MEEIDGQALESEGDDRAQHERPGPEDEWCGDPRQEQEAVYREVTA